MRLLLDAGAGEADLLSAEEATVSVMILIGMAGVGSCGSGSAMLLDTRINPDLIVNL